MIRNCQIILIDLLQLENTLNAVSLRLLLKELIHKIIVENKNIKELIADKFMHKN